MKLFEKLKMILTEDNSLQLLVVVIAILAGIAFLDFPILAKNLNQLTEGEFAHLEAAAAEMELYNFQSNLQPIWDAVRQPANDTSTFFGRVESYPDLYAQKLSNAGLVITEDGLVIPQYAVGKLRAPFKFLVVGGSSMLEDLGRVLETRLQELPEMTVIRKGVYSSGLNRKDYFNWNRELKLLTAEHKPDAIVAKFGGNDGQAIRDDSGNYYNFGTSAWENIYEERVHEFMQTASKGAEKVYWLGNPIGHTASFRARLSTTNAIQKQVSDEFDNVVFVSTWDRFAVNGSYAQVVENDAGERRAAKYGDGIHLTEHGGNIVADLLLPVIEEDLYLPESE